MFFGFKGYVYQLFKRFSCGILSILGGVFLLSSVSHADFSEGIDIPYTEFQLDNGLTLLVHQDRKAPIVAVNIWYHVGSKDERPGITGFAHLFEHLMFNGSENYDGEWFLPLQEAGGTDLNGTTWFDRTNYFQNVPAPALDMVLWMESDRMGHFINAVTQDALDEQRDVVKNEKRQGDNRPYGEAQYAQLAAMFPAGHPYSWSTIGSMEDLEAASLDDVKEWFARFYGAANATLVIAGDVDPQQVFTKVNHYFGDIASGPALNKQERWIAKRHDTRRELMFDDVPQTRLTRAWNTPPFGDEEHLALQLVASVLAQGKNSRLYQRLVYQEQLATSVVAAQQGFEIAGMFEIEVYLKQDVDIEQVESILTEEVELLIKKGVSRKELKRFKTTVMAREIRALEKIGGFSGKAQTLARYQTYLGDAKLFKRDLERLESMTRKQLQSAAKRWLSSGDYNLVIKPQKSYQVAEQGADRSSLPGPGAVPDLALPEPEELFLSNGLRVLFTQRSAVPVTEMLMQFGSGYAADPSDKLGIASVTAAMLDEGANNLSALDIAEQLELLGAGISASASLDSSTVSLSALDNNIQESLSLFSSVIRQPNFPVKELERVKSNWLDLIVQEQASPFSIALRQLPPLLYGEDHAYGIPFTGSGYKDTVSSIERSHLIDFHRNHYGVDNATLMIVGGLSKSTLVPLLEKYFSGWSEVSPATLEDANQGADLLAGKMRKLLPVAAPEQPVIYLIDRPNAPQSLILGGQLLPPTGEADAYIIDMASQILGGSFNSRINMNLREDKGWAYGARTMTADALSQRPLLYYAPVQVDKTLESLQELIREAQAYISDQPPTTEELDRFKASYIRSLPGKFETNRSVLAALSSMVEFERPLNYIEQQQRLIGELKVNDLLPAIAEHIRPASMIWLIVGDLTQVQTVLEEAKIAPVIVLSP